MLREEAFERFDKAFWGRRRVWKRFEGLEVQGLTLALCRASGVQRVLGFL